MVACEASGRVRDAFRDRGHNAWSIDLLGPEDIPIEYAHAQRWPAYHLEGDCLWWPDSGPDGPWDMLIAFPPCTFLTNAGSRWLYEGGRGTRRNESRWAAMAAGASFFNMLWSLPIPRKCLENPIMHRHARALVKPEPTQTVHPHWFGTNETKATQLYLHRLPPLERTHWMPEPHEPRVHWEGPSKDREFLRSLTDPNMALTMADQWSCI